MIQNHAVQLVHGLSWAEFLQDEFRNVTVFVPLHLGQKQVNMENIVFIWL